MWTASPLRSRRRRPPDLPPARGACRRPARRGPKDTGPVPAQGRKRGSERRREPSRAPENPPVRPPSGHHPASTPRKPPIRRHPGERRRGCGGGHRTPVRRRAAVCPAPERGGRRPGGMVADEVRAPAAPVPTRPGDPVPVAGHGGRWKEPERRCDLVCRRPSPAVRPPPSTSPQGPSFAGRLCRPRRAALLGGEAPRPFPGTSPPEATPSGLAKEVRERPVQYQFAPDIGQRDHLSPIVRISYLPPTQQTSPNRSTPTTFTHPLVQPPDTWPVT